MSESGADEKNRARTHVMLLCDKNGSVHVEINVDTMKNIEEEEEDGVNLVNENRKEILEEKEEVGGGSQNRQVLAKLEKLDEDEDATLCSICLDEFTEEDPVTQTVCEHGFHLQCVMQWAQRSHECPLCFHALQLKDPVMNELLPFDEYVDPRQLASTNSMLQTWELERFLVRLAHAERRASRHSRRRELSDASAPRAIIGRRSARSFLGGGSERSTLEPSGSEEESITVTSNSFPSSWPPRNCPSLDTSGSGATDGPLSPMFQGIKSKLASLRTSTARELKNLFGSPSASHSRS